MCMLVFNLFIIFYYSCCNFWEQFQKFPSFELRSLLAAVDLFLASDWDFFGGKLGKKENIFD